MSNFDTFDLISGREDMGDYVLRLLREIFSEMGCEREIDEELAHRVVHRTIERDRRAGQMLDSGNTGTLHQNDEIL